MQQRQTIIEGHCICEGFYMGARTDCPQYPLHLRDWRNYRTWRCQACSKLVMRQDWPLRCNNCGGMDFDEVAVDEMLDYTREQLLRFLDERYAIL